MYVGPFIHCKLLKELDICESGAIGVDEDGKIAFIDRDATDTKSREGWNEAKTIRAPNNGFFFPGFIGIAALHINQQSRTLKPTKQTPTSTPPNIPIAASSDIPPFSPGFKPTPSRSNPRYPPCPKPIPSTRAVYPAPSPTAPQPQPTTPQPTYPPPTSWPTSASPRVNAPS